MTIGTNKQGFTYLSLMFSVTLIGITLAGVARPWKTIIQREREADLLARGIEIQSAIGAYSTRMKAGRIVQGEYYPHTLEELTRPPKPLLRKVYGDPMTNRPFELVRAPTGGVMGVRSRSDAQPLRQHEFPPAVRHFDGMKRYRDWVFQHPNASGLTVPFQGLSPGLPGSAAMPVPAGTLPTPQAPAQNLPGFQSTTSSVPSTTTGGSFAQAPSPEVQAIPPPPVP
ncbi:hypothetical protein YTPLAS18_23840 [Nitrospira sp.]|nr:hypothetical protein YTPLAS18_23840 [Nitrospira sp.]